jgi:hypothetical protein
MRTAWSIAALALTLLGPARAQTADEVRERAAELRPADGALAVYRLDWARDLDAARARAAKERRPLLLLVVENISGGGDLFTGHC